MHIRLHGISKRFGQVQAVDRVDFEARPGTVTALLGENGAGKSTLMKLLFGLHRPDAGYIELDGQTQLVDSPRTAIRFGIGMVFQQFSLIGSLTVRENLALVLPQGAWWIGRGARRLAAIDRHLAAVLPEIDPNARVADLSVGQVQSVELAKVLLLRARCVILDEPSAVLSPTEAQQLWRSIRQLAERGLSVVLITHKLADVRACADRVSVMRAGRLVGDVPAGDLDEAAVVRLMVGHAPDKVRTPLPRDPAARVRLWVKAIRAGSLNELSLQVHAGEIVGVAGVSGSGQTELAQALGGVLPVQAGEVILDGERLRAPRYSSPTSANLAYIPEQPLLNAVAPDLSLSVNLALKRVAGLSFVPDRRQLERHASALIARFDVRPPDPRALAGWLSGGNLQKLVAARELSESPAVVVACYPTMGLDITAAAQVYESLFGLAREGSAVLWISEDLDDLMTHAHRIAVMLDGRVVRVLDAAETTLAELGSWMTGSGVRPCAKSA